MDTAKPMFSCMRLMPGPDVAVMALQPAQDAPTAEQIAAISSSVCKNTPPDKGSSSDSRLGISLAGVIGYPAMKSHPAAIAPSARAMFP